MEAHHWDILVVGAGPAGSAAARAAARCGTKVLLVERRSIIGVPVQCAEYIPAMLLGKIDLGRRFVAQSVKGMKTYRRNSPETFTKAPGYIVHRDQFDQTLAKAAQDDGVTIMTEAKVMKKLESGVVIIRQKKGENIHVLPRIIIGADGPHSTVGAWVGAKNRHLLPGVQMTLALNRPVDHTKVYFHPDIYAGYGWLFPKKKLANVGLGLKRSGLCQQRVRVMLDRFVADLKAEGTIKGPPLSYAAGWIPAEPVRKAVYGNTVLVGDAAGHTHPITGAGIFAAVIGGQMAGRWAGRAVKESNIALLARYDDQWLDLMADTSHRAYLKRMYMEQHWGDFNITTQKCWVAYRDYYA